LKFAVDADARGTVRRLARFSATHPPRVFETRQQVIGFRHEPRGLFMDPDPDNLVHQMTQFCHAWMRAVFVHGVFGTAAFLLLKSLVPHGSRDVWEALRGYVGLWTWASQVHNKGLKDIFSPKRAASSRNLFKWAASDAPSDGLFRPDRDLA
jgi:hypothetical protein